MRPVSASSAPVAGAPLRSGHRVRAYIGLGANLGDAAATLTWAVEALDAVPGIRVRRVSRLYVTAPWGVIDQPDFRNAVVAIDHVVPARRPAATAALALLAGLKSIEREAGRRPGRRWGPRELDLDLLVYGRHRIRVERPPSARSIDAADDPARAARQLEVPHRDAGERLFVLAPLADSHRGSSRRAGSRRSASRRAVVATEEPDDAVRRVGHVGPAAGRWRWVPSARG